MATISERVTEIIVERLEVDAKEVTSDASFIRDLGADSLDTVELTLEFENEFNIDIPDNKAAEMKTVSDVIAFIERRLDKGEINKDNEEDIDD